LASRYTAEYTQESIFFIPLTAEDAEESKKQGENKGAKYVSLAILGGLSE